MSHWGLMSRWGPSLTEYHTTVLFFTRPLELSSSADLQTLAASAQILTSRPDELTAADVTTAAEIANTLLLSPNVTESVTVAAIATVSQLLNASTKVNTEENDAALSLTLTLDHLSVNQSASLGTSQSQVVQPNLVIQSAQIPVADTQGVQFTALTGSSGSFVADRIQFNSNTAGVQVEDGFAADVLVHVRFPPAVRAQRRSLNVSLGFVLYQSDSFFRSRLYRRQQGSSSVRVVSASVRARGRAVVPQRVHMMFRPTVLAHTRLYDYACVFWDYSVNDWSTQGCVKGRESDGLLQCFCNHTTNFAALMSFREDYKYAEALNIISTVGLSLSVVGLIITIAHQVREGFKARSFERKNVTLVQVSICVSLLAFIITFLVGVNNPAEQSAAAVKVNTTEINTIPHSDVHIEPDRGPCTAVTALLHFFLLATFTWNAVFGTQLTVLIRTSTTHLPPSCTSVSIAVGWGVPAVMMAITLGATYRVNTPLDYRREEFCWLAAVDRDGHFDFGKPMFWGFLLPVGLILVYNTTLLVLIALETCKTNPVLASAKSKSSSAGKKLLVCFSLAVLLGLSWILGYLVLTSEEEAHLIFSIFFCICTTTQGLQIFILFTARKPAFRKAVALSFRYLSSASGKYSLKSSRASHSTSSDKNGTWKDLDQELPDIDLQDLAPSR
ncbi:adhesion G-protein coupled receptor G7 [Myripristis murdjan]|uniref:adhesion G-protein coupled receptor G7 n=1 Tax=Myripristis murdjan TaxID=586833 RepID=UPI001175F95F|nr:adhesion G-protein coupled receptor G7 [Myripristis murdjan]